MSVRSSGVFPVFENVFKIITKGRTGEPGDLVPIAEMETFSVEMDGQVQEWSPMDAEGWVKRMMTGKGFTIKLSGKRCIGDPGNDYVARCAWMTGNSCDSSYEWVYPNGDKLSGDCVVNVTNPGTGDAVDVGALEIELMSHGKPTYTEAE